MATVGWIELTDLANYVRDHLQKSQAEALRPFWDSIILRAATSAYNEIVTAFANSGYSLAQINQWDRRIEFQMDIGAWWALMRVRVLHPDISSKDAIDALDRRWELWGTKDEIPAVILTINGVVVDPDRAVGQPSYGAFDTSNDLFVMDLEDSRIGETTRF